MHNNSSSFPGFRRAGRLLLLAFSVIQLLRAEAPAPIEGGYTFVVIPDSQKYVEKRPELYALQTGWVAANAQKYSMVALLHVGDITQHNTREQWEWARRAHRLYEGILPAVYASGNHDNGVRGKTATRDSYFSEYIPLSLYRSQPGFGGVYDKEPGRTENSFHLFEAGGKKWLVITLEFAPRDDVLRWANDVARSHADRSVIVVTHAYLRPEAARYDRTIPTPAGPRPNKGLDTYPLPKTPDGYNDGEDIWKKFASQQANIALVLCGHVCTSARLESVGTHGNKVQQVLVDYQNAKNGGDAWLRLLQFLPDGRHVRISDYSPLLDETSADESCSFELEIETTARQTAN